MTNEKLEQLWEETDKNICESYKKLRLSYQEGSITKKTYYQEKSFIDGFYQGWRNLFEKLSSDSK